MNKIGYIPILNTLDKQDIINAYAKYKTLDKAAEVFDVHLETLRKYFITNNIEYTKRQKYTCDHEFFSRDNEASFYWAGFIAADGNISKDNRRISIELGI